MQGKQQWHIKETQVQSSSLETYLFHADMSFLSQLKYRDKREPPCYSGSAGLRVEGRGIDTTLGQV